MKKEINLLFKKKKKKAEIPGLPVTSSSTSRRLWLLHLSLTDPRVVKILVGHQQLLQEGFVLI